MQTTLGSALHYPQRIRHIIANLIIKPYAIIEAWGAKSRCLLKRKGGKEKRKTASLRHTEKTPIYYIRYSL